MDGNDRIPGSWDSVRLETGGYVMQKESKPWHEIAALPIFKNATSKVSCAIHRTFAVYAT